MNLLDCLGFASVEINKITSLKKSPKSIRVYVKPQNIAKGCELNFIQIAFKDNNEWEVDADGMQPPANPPFYYDWDSTWKRESGDSMKYYKDVKYCTSCCENSKATVLKRIYWRTVNGEMEFMKMTDSIKKNMDALLLKNVHNKTF